MEIANGIHTDISIEDYHKNTSHISATSIKEAKVSLKQFDWHRRGLMPKSEGLHLDFGNAFELALLDRSNFDKFVAIEQQEYWIELANQEQIAKGKEAYTTPRNSTRYKAEASKFYGENEGKYIINATGKQSYWAIEQMLTSCFADPTIKSLIEGTEYQLSLFWTDEQTGLNLKTRPDICKRKKNVIVNLKTTEDGSPKSFSRDLAKFNYPLQACVEISGCLGTGLMTQVDNYFWLVVEKSEPFNATIYEFIESDIRSTMMEYEYLLNIIAQAKEKNEWPGYTQQADNKYGILQAKLPLWYKEV
jgi:hypothetical protein